ncbi:MAG: ABC transporter substrate-binding protein [Spirochaetales bacterium]|nr:ABC transporter substrate-binding protein [Spirochaetales bacterium]
MAQLFSISSVAKKIFPYMVFFLFVTGSAALLFTACSNDTVNPEQIVILVPPSTSSIPFYDLADRDPVEGTDIIVKTFTQHPQALALLLKGDADFILTGTTQGWESYWSGNAITSVSSYVWGVSSLCIKDTAIRSIHDLKNRKIALPFKNSPLDIQTRIILTKTGLKPDSDVEIVYSAFTASIGLLQQEKVDAVALPEPLATNMVQNKGLTRLFEYVDAWKGVTGNDGFSPQVTLFGLTDKLNRLNHFATALHDELGKSISMIQHDPKVYAEKYQKDFNLPAGVIEESLLHTSFIAAPFDEHKQLMLDYYEIIKSYLPVKSQGFNNSFFFQKR